MGYECLGSGRVRCPGDLPLREASALSASLRTDEETSR